MQCGCCVCLRLISSHTGPSGGHVNLIKQNICDESNITGLTNLHLHTDTDTVYRETSDNNTSCVIAVYSLYFYPYFYTACLLFYLYTAVTLEFPSGDQ